MVTHLNPKIATHTSCIQGEGGASLFYVTPGIVLDTNSLDLYTGAHDELVAYSAKLRASPAAIPQFPLAQARRTKALVLNITHACQLRCDYCYLVNNGTEMRGHMTEEVATQALQFALPKDVEEKFHISFFGGEALLNFPLIKFVVERLASRPAVSFGITTNGCLITAEVAQFIKSHNFTEVVLSLDGPEELHNLHRKRADGSGTFHEVMSGLAVLNAAGFNKVTLRATFLPDCTRLLERAVFLNALCAQGFACNVSIEPACIAEYGCQSPAGFSASDFEKLEKEYCQLAEYIGAEIRAGRSFRFQNVMTYVDRLFNKKPHATECGAGVGYVAVSPDGDLHACHREDVTKIGTVRFGYDEQVRAKWLDNRYYCSKKCCACAIRNVCGGGCRENALRTQKDITRRQPEACEFTRIWVIAAAHILQYAGNEALSKLYRTAAGRPPVIALVREAGGFGDIINLGAAALAAKTEQPNAQVIAYVPNEFMTVACHLEGVSTVVGLGPLEYLAANRRWRCAPIEAKYPYFAAIDPAATVVDLWCPATKYESEVQGPVLFSRAEIFAQQVGYRGPRILPVWRTTASERQAANQFLQERSPCGKPVIGFAPRGTDVARSLPAATVVFLHNWLSLRYTVVYLDCIKPEYAQRLIGYTPALHADFAGAVALIEQCDALVSVDSGPFHAGLAVATPTIGLFSKTDAMPYLANHPEWVFAVQSSGNGICDMPCNNSARKGMTEECSKECTRVFSDDSALIGAIEDIMPRALSPAASKEKLRRITRLVEHK